MEKNVAVGFRLIKIAAVYLVIAVGGGILMGLSKDHTLATVHSHLALLGWTSMALTGLVYVALPAPGGSALSAAHFWLHNLGLPIMMTSLVFYAYGYAEAEPMIGIGSSIVFVSLLLFAVNVFRNARARPPAGAV